MYRRLFRGNVFADGRAPHRQCYHHTPMRGNTSNTLATHEQHISSTLETHTSQCYHRTPHFARYLAMWRSMRCVHTHIHHTHSIHMTVRRISIWYVCISLSPPILPSLSLSFGMHHIFQTNLMHMNILCRFLFDLTTSARFLASAICALARTFAGDRYSADGIAAGARGVAHSHSKHGTCCYGTSRAVGICERIGNCTVVGGVCVCTRNIGLSKNFLL